MPPPTSSTYDPLCQIIMPPVKLCLSSVRGRAELAERLNVDVRALSLVNLVESVVCSSSKCELPAIQYNQGKCILCSQSWFPREVNEKGDRVKNCRGHGLFGPQFRHLLHPSHQLDVHNSINKIQRPQIEIEHRVLRS